RPFDITEYTATLSEASETLAQANNLLLNANDVTTGEALDERIQAVKSTVYAIIWTAAAATLIVALLIVLAVKFIPSRGPHKIDPAGKPDAA
ncbi:MAG: hypothetical protein AAGL98_10075, partial [Planctomycetota bacterium]